MPNASEFCSSPRSHEDSPRNKKREAERRKARSIHWPSFTPSSLTLTREGWGGDRQRAADGCTLSAQLKCIGARSPSGASRRLLSRRPNATTQPRPRFTRTHATALPSPVRSRLSQAPGTPVVMPEGTMPGPPESGLQIRPQEPHSLRHQECPRDGVPLSERDLQRDLYTSVTLSAALIGG
jgi:hypothetical protein